MKRAVHIFGASGSGTTTIAREVCEKLDCDHFDSDNYFWLPTKEPFSAERPREECLTLLKNDLLGSGQYILSGSLSGWGEVLIPLFDLVVFVYVPQDIRLERLRKREHERYGAAALPGGDRHNSVEDFLEWATAYDSGTRGGRSLEKHEKLLGDVKCRVLKIVNNCLDKSVNEVVAAIKE